MELVCVFTGEIFPTMCCASRMDCSMSTCFGVVALQATRKGAVAGSNLTGDNTSAEVGTILLLD